MKGQKYLLLSFALVFTFILVAPNPVCALQLSGLNPIQDMLSHTQSLAYNAVSNPGSEDGGKAKDTEPPLLVSSTVNGAALRLEYNETLRSSLYPSILAFKYQVGSQSARYPSSVSVSGSVVTLTLNQAVGNNDTVKLSYQPILICICDPAGNKAATFKNRDITNITGVDMSAPALISGVANGNSISLSFDKTLDTGSIPPAASFSVQCNAAAGPVVQTVSLNNRDAILTLDGPVQSGQNVTLTYIPGNPPLKGANGTPAAAFTNQAVANQTPAPVPPALLSATVDGVSLVLAYDKTIDAGSAPAGSDYQVTVDGSSAIPVNSVNIYNANVVLSLATPVNYGQTVSLNYTPGASPVKDLNGTPAAALTNQAVANQTSAPVPPALLSATVDGVSLVLAYDKTIDAGSAPAGSDFLVTVDGSSAISVNSVNIYNANVVLTLATPVNYGQTVSLNYTPGASPVKDLNGTPAAALTNQAVANQTSAVVPPALLSATVDSASLVLAYDRTIDAGSAPAGSDFLVTVDGSSAISVNSVNIYNANVVLTLATPVNYGQTVSLNYTPGATPVKDLNGTPAAALTNQAVANQTPAAVSNTRVIANWDVVPLQVINSPCNIGVVAFHESGADVSFRINGGTPQIVTSPTYNDQSRVWEYWISFNPALYPDGPVTIEATAYPGSDINSPGAHILDPLTLYANSGGTCTNNTVKWADSVNGSDSSGDGSEALPYATLEKAFVETGSGGTVYLKAGTYQLTRDLPDQNYQQWTTITAAPGLSRDQVRIQGGGPTGGYFGETMVKWTNVVLFKDDEPSGYSTLLNFDSNDLNWFDRVEIYNQRGMTDNSDIFNAGGSIFYMNDCYIHDFSGIGGVWQRNCSISNIGGDVWRGQNNMFLVNITVDNIAPNPESHSDMIQFYNPGTVIENVIMYNIKATNLNAQGIFGGPVTDIAIVNVLMEKVQDITAYSQPYDSWNHVLLWHMTTHNSDIVLLSPAQCSNWNIQNNIFSAFSMDGNPCPTSLADSVINANHFTRRIWTQGGGLPGNNITENNPFFIAPAVIDGGYQAPGSTNYHLLPSSPGYHTGVPLECAPADIDGRLYDSSNPSRGAYES